MPQDEILDSNLINNEPRRRSLLPTWIKVFLWIFMIFGVVAPIGLIFGVLGFDFNISLYGLETSKVFSIIGIGLISIFGLKGAVSFGLWTEKEWAVDLAILDAILGILVCIIAILLPLISSNGGFNFSFRLELFVLIPYLLKMKKIKPEWIKARVGI